MNKLLTIALLSFAATSVAQERILIQPRKGADPAELERVIQQNKGRRIKVLHAIGVHVIELPAGVAAKDILAKLEGNPHFGYVEEDKRVSPELVTNDPLALNAWQNARVNAPAAWDNATGAGIAIAICDTGVDADHPDLMANLVPGWNTALNNNVTDDFYGHGTLVAGVAAAIGNNAKGALGVAMAAKIMPFRISANSDATAYYSDMAECITMAADRGARVANLSYGGACTSSTVQSAGAYLRQRRGVLVSAAGNANTQIFTDNLNSVCVSALTSSNGKASFSNWGPGIDIAAPGVGIYGTARGGGYRTGSGTSFAAPIVAGVYGLVFSANPKLGPSQADSIVFSTAKDLGAVGNDNVYGVGLVDAAAAVLKAKASVQELDTTAPTVEFLTPTHMSVVKGQIAVDISAIDDVAITKITLAVNDVVVLVDSTLPYSYVLDTTQYPDGNLALEAIAEDSAGNVTGVRITVNVDNVAACQRGGSGKPCKLSQLQGGNQ